MRCVEWGPSGRPQIDTAQLVERCRQGDDLAWERLVRQYQGRVYALAYHYVHDADEARDLAQEAVLPVYEQLGKFDGPAFLPWLLRLTPPAISKKPRRYPRAKVRGLTTVDINFGDAAAFDSGRLQVVGAGGASLQVLGPYPVSTVMKVGFTLPKTGHSIACRAIVRNAVRGEGVGVEFLDLPTRDREHLHGFVARARAYTRRSYARLLRLSRVNRCRASLGHRHAHRGRRACGR